MRSFSYWVAWPAFSPLIVAFIIIGLVGAVMVLVGARAADGSFAEFTVTTEKRLAPKPAGITFEQAATLNVAGLTALQGLRDRARVRVGGGRARGKVVINTR